MAGGERYELPPQRLGRWLERWADAHGGIAETAASGTVVTFVAGDGAAVECEPPFPPMEGDLLAHVARERVVGVLLVRLGGHAAGVFRGTRLVSSKVGTRPVHGRHRKGGSSSGRFARRREGQARVALEAAADVAARVLLEHRRDLDAIVLGGDRRALGEVLEDPRLRPLRPLVSERVLDVPDPRLKVLQATPDRFRSTLVRPRA
jgi:Actinobacteria/chloroflexi VLRF1 release factor